MSIYPMDVYYFPAQILWLSSFQVQARIYTTQMDKFTGECSRAPCHTSPSRCIIDLPPPPQQETIASTKHGTKFLPMLFPARKSPAIFGNLQINHVMLLTPLQVPPPARTSIGVKELPLGRCSAYPRIPA